LAGCPADFQERCVSYCQDLLVAALRRSSEWRNRISLYWSEAVDDSAAKDKYQEYLLKMKLNKQISDTCAVGFITDVSHWNNTLRPHACGMLIDAAVKRVLLESQQEAGGNDEDKFPLMKLVGFLVKHSQDKVLS
jgi:hypothetical protein